MYSWIDWKKEHDILKRHGESTRTIQIKVETKIKTLHLAARENQCIIKRDLQLFTAIKKKKKNWRNSRDKIQSTRDDDQKQHKGGSYWQMDSQTRWEIRENGATNGRYRRSNQILAEEKINRTENPRRTKIWGKNLRRKTDRGDETGASKIKQNKRGR